MDSRPGVQVVDAQVPLATMFGYATDLRSATQGRATFSMEFSHYEPMNAALAEEVAQKARAAAKPMMKTAWLLKQSTEGRIYKNGQG